MRKNNKNRRKEPVVNIGKEVSEFIAFFHNPDGSDLYLNVPTEKGPALSIHSQMSFRRDDQWTYFRYTTLQKLIEMANAQTTGRFYVWVAKLGQEKDLIEYYSGRQGWLSPSQYAVLKKERDAQKAKREQCVKLKYYIPAVSKYHADKAVWGYTKKCPSMDAALYAAYLEVYGKKGEFHLNKFICYLADKPAAECCKVGEYPIDDFEKKTATLWLAGA